jgi:uncharacterized membrane protein YbaN (DUF454 family)
MSVLLGFLGIVLTLVALYLFVLFTVGAGFAIVDWVERRRRGGK